MNAIPQDLVDGLRGQYELRGVVGRGGMATVYWAMDLKHQREVALKVLRPELAANLGAERFLREIALAAQLQHPHILMLIDSGQTGDTLYYVMPLVEGGSLRKRIDAGRITLGETVTIAERVAHALAYAHEQGVVHRDIKPENILFSRGYAVVADFGIAKAISTAGGAVLTQTGFALGTVGYMSPEQAAGSQDLGPASDVYSLACVAYEMLLGSVPGVWLSDGESDEGRFGDIAPSHRALLDALPRHVEPALARALARRSATRLRDPVEFVAALKGSVTLAPVERPAVRTAERPPLAVPEVIEPEPEGWLALPSQIGVQTTLPGEIPTSAFGDLLLEVQAETGDAGKSDNAMGTFSWNNASMLEGGGIVVTVRPSNGETSLRVSENVGNYKVITTLASVVGGGFATVLLVAFADEAGIIVANMRLMVAAGAVIVPGAIAAGRLALKSHLRLRRQKLAGLLRKLAEAARKSIGA